MMQLILLTLLPCAVAMVNWTRFDMNLSFEDKNVTDAIIATSKERRPIECARTCVELQSCESFSYNTVTDECQYHETVFTSADGATVQTGLKYYYNTEAHSKWCPVEKGFKLLSDDGPCVKFHTDRKTWYEANQTCASYSPNSRLVVLDNSEKNELVKSAGRAISDKFVTGVRIGIIEDGQNHYKWTDGTRVVFTDWGSFDDSTTLTEDCVGFCRIDNWRWKQSPCTNEGHYVCEVVRDI